MSRLLLFLAAALLGLGIFAVMAWRSVDVSSAAPAVARARFEQARAPFERARALLSRDAAGRFVRRRTLPPQEPGEIGQLVVLSYRVEREALVRAEVPFWFYRLKAPAAQWFVRDTGLDLETLGMTAADLAQEGPCLIVDEADSAGDRLLVWTE